MKPLLGWKVWLALGFIFFAALAQAGDRLPLWEADNGQSRIYLFGSIHVCKASCFPLPKAMEKRLATSQALVVELDPRKPETQIKLLEAARLPEGQSLQTLLPATDWEMLKQVSEQLGLPREFVAGLRPWMAGTMLTLLSAQHSGFETEQGVDLAVIQKASAQGLSLEELETVEEQIAALGAGSALEQREALSQSLAFLREGKMAAYLDQLLEAWKRGDEERLQPLLDEGLKHDSEIYLALFDRRNLRMAERLDKAMRDRRSRFVVVGIGHLVGPKGIPALLARRGWKLRQLEASE